MNHFNKKMVLRAALCGFLCMVPLIAEAEGDKYENWLKDQVHLIITKAEAREFKALPNDAEKDKFIALFWAKRDPAPDTAVNEFRDEYLKRIEYSDRMFSYGGIKGSERSMGKVYVIFGPPKRRDANGNIWVYDPVPRWNLPTEFIIRFYQFVGGYAIDENETAKQALSLIDNYAEKTILHPELKEAPSISVAPPDSGTSEAALLEALAAGGEDRYDFPVRCQVFTTKIAAEKVLVTCLLDIDEKGPADSKPFVFGRIVKEGGTPLNFHRGIDKVQEGAGGRIMLVFPLEPGVYQAFLGIESVDKTRISAFKKTFDVPNFLDGKLGMSTPVLSAGVAKAPADLKTPEFLFGKDVVLPKFNQVYSAKDTLYFLLQCL